MQHIKKIALLLFIAVCFISCEKEDPIVSSAKLDKDIVEYDNVAQFLAITSAEKWTITITYQEAGTTSWCNVSPSSGEGSRSDIVLSYSENNSYSDRIAEIIVTFPSKTIHLFLTQTGVYNPNPEDDPSLTPSTLVSDAYQNWTELPAYDSKSGLAFIYHNTFIKNKQVRNYSTCYDTLNRIARWVAYPLSYDYTGSESRSDAWGYNPKIPARCQPHLFRGFGVANYDRGHQLPSADRTVDKTTNAQTFYYTNMTAQNSTLNSGVWGELEGKIRDWRSSCDTIYVVTGPALTTKESPSIEYIKDNSGRNVAIPKAYFKVVLKFTKATNTYKAIGFWFLNGAPQTAYLTVNDACTVRSIETRTGIDFFANLPKDIQEKIETECKPGEWW